MTTRIGSSSDFAAVVPMLRKLRSQEQHFDPALYQLHPDAERRFARWAGVVGEDPRSTLVVAEENGQLIGFAYAVIEQDLPIYACEEFALIREWWVEPAFRGRGIGRALIDSAMKELGEVGVAQLRVRTGAADEDARAVLAHCGFRPGACEMVKELQP